MSNGRPWLAALIILSACNGDKDTTQVEPVDTDTVVDDTGDPPDTGDTEECTATIADVYPINGQSDWYYRDELTVLFDQDAQTLADLNMLGNGEAVDLSVVYNSDGLEATVLPTSGEWAGSTTYNLAIELCGATSEYSFVTSPYGAPLDIEDVSLAGNTYYVDMSEAIYTQPAGVGTIIRQFLTNPLLIDITAASTEELTLIGAQGLLDEVTAEVTQDTRYETWDFGSADFATSPYFSARANKTTFTYIGEDVPVYDFSFDGTFSADATTIGGMNFSGVGDTRNMGPLLNLGNSPGATCELLNSVGVECISCPDKEPYCLMLVGSFLDAALLPDIDVEIITE
jgi:hypothetical protein